MSEPSIRTRATVFIAPFCFADTRLASGDAREPCHFFPRCHITGEQRTLLPLYMAGFGVLSSRPEGGHGKRHIIKILIFWVSGLGRRFGTFLARFWQEFRSKRHFLAGSGSVTLAGLELSRMTEVAMPRFDPGASGMRTMPKSGVHPTKTPRNCQKSMVFATARHPDARSPPDIRSSARFARLRPADAATRIHTMESLLQLPETLPGATSPPVHHTIARRRDHSCQYHATHPSATKNATSRQSDTESPPVTQNS